MTPCKHGTTKLNEEKGDSSIPTLHTNRMNHALSPLLSTDHNSLSNTCFSIMYSYQDQSYSLSNLHTLQFIQSIYHKSIHILKTIISYYKSIHSFNTTNIKYTTIISIFILVSLISFFTIHYTLYHPIITHIYSIIHSI